MSLQLKLEDFIPGYADFTDGYEHDMFDIYEDEPENVFFRKREFYNNRLEAMEEKPSKAGIPLRSQLNISRFLSSRTLNDEVLLFHAMGSGKTCSSVNISELSREINPQLKRTLVLVKGGPIKRNFINELAKKCTSGKYIPENYENLTKGEKVYRLNKLVNQSYEIHTFETFAKTIQKYSEQMIKREYSNRVIIIDEVHNIRLQPQRKQGLNIYNVIHKFLHSLENRKIVLMSGTPMRDRPEEFASVMNLILPLSQQLPTGKEFLEEFFDNGKLINTSILKERIRGRISYLRSIESSIVKKFEGDFYKDMTKIKTYTDKMSEYQSKYYTKAYNQDIGSGVDISNIDEDVEESEDKTRGLYDKSRQASLFVFPDGSYGQDGFNKYIVKTGNTYSLSKSLKDELTNNNTATINQVIENIRKYSSIYASTIKEIIEHPDQNIFVYNKYVQGSGSILFGELLKLVGFERSRGYLDEDKKSKYISKEKLEKIDKIEKQIEEKLEETEEELDIDFLENEVNAAFERLGIVDEKEEKEDELDFDDFLENEVNAAFERLGIVDEKEEEKEEKEEEKDSTDNTVKQIPRFSIITGETTSEVEVERIIDKIFNNPENKNGKYIRVIIGSQIISEGKSLNNVRQIHIQTPHWNNSETEQAITRGIRVFSHNDLNPEDRTVSVYRHLAVPSNSTESVNYAMYKLSEDKDIRIKQIERVCKVSAFDCGLNKNRNRLSEDIDGSRECDYMSCSYRCRYGEMKINEEDIFNDTYNLYYTQNDMDAIITLVRQLFRKKFSFDFSQITKELNTIPPVTLIRTLKYIIDNSIVLINRYGFPCYLREEHNLYFLVDEITQPNSFLLSYYTQHPDIKPLYKFEQIVKLSQYKYKDDKIKKIKTLDPITDKKKIIEYIESLPLSLREAYLESVVIAKRTGKETDLTKLIYEYFISYIIELPDKTVSTILLDEEDTVKCLPRDSLSVSDWYECDENIESELETKRIADETNLQLNPYGWYAIISSDNKFKLKKVLRGEEKEDEEEGKKKDSRKVPRGIVCSTNVPKQKTANIINIINQDKINIDIDILSEKYADKVDALKNKIENMSTETMIKKIISQKFYESVYTKEKFMSSNRKVLEVFYFWNVSASIYMLCDALEIWFKKNNLVLYEKK